MLGSGPLLDLTEYLAGPIIFPTSTHLVTGEKLPIVLGHEFSAVVSEIGAHVVSDLQVGDNVGQSARQSKLVDTQYMCSTETVYFRCQRLIVVLIIP